MESMLKKLICLLMAVILCVGLVACGGTQQQTEEQQTQEQQTQQEPTQPETGLEVGFGRQDITPDGKVHLQGGDWKNRVSTDVRDYMQVTCIALREGEQTILLYTVDYKVITENISQPAKVYISSATGVPEDHIILSATHTHSSTAVRYNWEGVETERQRFYTAATEAAKTAMEDLTPAEVYSGSTQTEQMTFCRHYAMNDGTVAGSNFGDWSSGIAGHVKEADQELQIVKFDRGSEKKPVILMSFPTHGTLNESGLSVSADFPSPSRTHIESSTGSLVAYFMGAAGDQVPSSRISGEAFSNDYREYGKKLGDYVIEALPTLTKVESTGMKYVKHIYTGNTNKKGVEKLVAAQQILSAVEQYGTTSQEVQSLCRELGISSRHEANWIRTRASLGTTMDMDLYVFALGDLSFVIAPYEMFGENGRQIKDGSVYGGDKTFIITNSEGAKNYIATSDAFDYGSYESHCCYFEQGSAEKLVTVYLDLLKELKGA